MTINKAQGQSFKFDVFYLRKNCFSHDQLYIALSRIGKKSAQYILLPHEKINNKCCVLESFTMFYIN